MITIDAHMDVPWIMTKLGAGFDLKEGHPNSMFSIPKAKEGGLDAAFFALYLSDDWQDASNPVDTGIELLRQVNRIREDPSVKIVKTYQEAIQAKASGLYPIFLGLEGGRLISESFLRLGGFAEIGVRYLTLTHNKNTSWADSATDEPNLRGLTDFGLLVIKKCNELGVIIDVSHVSDASANVAIGFSSKPVIASHSGVRNLVRQPRNVSDNLIRAIAASNGVICVPFVKKFIGHYTVADHIDYIASMVGSQHVGVGSDLDGARLINGFNSVPQWYETVALDLVTKGWNDIMINWVLGGNLARVIG